MLVIPSAWLFSKRTSDLNGLHDFHTLSAQLLTA